VREAKRGAQVRGDKNDPKSFQIAEGEIPLEHSIKKQFSKDKINRWDSTAKQPVQHRERLVLWGQERKVRKGRGKLRWGVGTVDRIGDPGLKHSAKKVEEKGGVEEGVKKKTPRKRGKKDGPRPNANCRIAEKLKYGGFVFEKKKKTSERVRWERGEGNRDRGE